jgi:tetratricopeptide (TPR) repeat protein
VRRHPLRDGDVIAVGSARMKFCDPDQGMRLQSIAAAGSVPDGSAPAPSAPAPASAPANRPSGREAASGAERQQRPSGRHRASGRQRARRKGVDSTLLGGGLLLAGLVVAIVVVMSVRGGVSKEAVGVINRAKRLARNGEYRGAIKQLRNLPPNSPSHLVERARHLQDEWRGQVAPRQQPRPEENDTGSAAAGLGLGGAVSPATAGGSAAITAAFAALEAADKQASEAATAGRFGDALAAYKPVLKKHEGTEAARQVTERRKKLLDDAADLWKSWQQRADSAAQEGRFDEAKAIFQEVIDKFGLADFVKLARDRLDYVNDLSIR